MLSICCGSVVRRYFQVFERNPQSFAYTCYVMYTQAIEDVINELAHRPDANDVQVQRQVFSAHDVNMDALTSYEIKYIESEVSKRWML